MVGCFKEMIFTYIDSSDISLSNGANRSSLSRFIQKLLKKNTKVSYILKPNISNYFRVSYVTISYEIQSFSRVGRFPILTSPVF